MKLYPSLHGIRPSKFVGLEVDLPDQSLLKFLYILGHLKSHLAESTFSVASRLRSGDIFASADAVDVERKKKTEKYKIKIKFIWPRGACIHPPAPCLRNVKASAQAPPYPHNEAASAGVHVTRMSDVGSPRDIDVRPARSSLLNAVNLFTDLTPDL